MNYCKIYCNLLIVLHKSLKNEFCLFASEMNFNNSWNSKATLFCYWRAVARQPTILYNCEIWPKSVGCKIVDLRSRMRSLYPGACGFGDMRSQFRTIAVIKDTLNEVSFCIDVCCLWKDSSRS